MKTVLFIFSAVLTLNAHSKSLPDSKSRTPQSYELAEEERQAEEIARGSNCKIIINLERFSGVKESQTIHSTVKDKKECENRARVHGYNLFPKEIKNKKVEISFEGK